VNATITFKVYGPDDLACTDPATATSTVKVQGTGFYESDPFTPTRAGTYRWVASYSGDEHNKPAGPTACEDPAETVTAAKATPIIRTLTLPVVPIGFPARDRALLARGAGPRGTIAFRLYGPNDHTCSGTPVFSMDQIVLGNGFHRSSWFVPQQAGTYRWLASYSGDANNTAAMTGCGDMGETVVVLPRRALLTTSASPPANVRNGPRARADG
jgi:hypothetical protein